MANPQKRRTDIVAYGFDRKGYTSEKPTVETEEFVIRYMNYNSEESLADADAVMIPSDIFENVTKGHSVYDGSYNIYECDKHRLAEREKELIRLFDKKGWACFFLGRLGNGKSLERKFDDLARRIANRAFARTKTHDPFPHLKCKADEFRKFFEEYGIAQTELVPFYGQSGLRKLATSSTGNEIYAAEVNGRSFFLPLKPQFRKNELSEILKTAADSIMAYKKRNDLYLPHWVDAVRFDGEQLTLQDVEELKTKLEQANLDLARWQRYKAILTASGKLLNEVVVDILRGYFGLNLKSEEAYIEDAMIFSDSGLPLYVVEIKGVSAGIKREQINQLDSHRERLELEHLVSGLLLINDFADIAGVEERKLKPIDNQHLVHAERLNVKILRTVTLIELMQVTENRPDRASIFLKACETASPLVLVPVFGEDCEP